MKFCLKKYQIFLKDDNKPKETINVVDTQEPSTEQEKGKPITIAKNLGHSSDSKIDSHEYEFKSESKGNPAWGIHPNFTHVLIFPKGLDEESKDESN